MKTLIRMAALVALVVGPTFVGQVAEAQPRNGGRGSTQQQAARATAQRTTAQRATARSSATTPSVNTKIGMPRLSRRAASFLAEQRAASEQAVDVKRTAPVSLFPTTPGASGQLTAGSTESSQPAMVLDITDLGPDGIMEAVGTFPVSGHVQDPQWGGQPRSAVDQWSTSDTISLTLERPGESSRVTVLNGEPSTGYGTQIPFRVQLRPGRNVLRYHRNAGNGGTSEGSEPYLREIVVNWDGN